MISSTDREHNESQNEVQVKESVGLEPKHQKQFLGRFSNFEVANSLVDVLVLAFGGWTLLVHRIADQQGTRFHLLAWSVGLLLPYAALILGLLIRQRRVPGRITTGSEGIDGETIRLCAFAFAAVGCWIVAWYPAHAWSFGILALALYAVFGTGPQSSIGNSPKPPGKIFVAVLVLAVGLTMTVKRPDIDDSYYVGMAVAVKEAGSQPLLCCDFVHQRDDLPIRKPSDRLRSLEVLLGVAAFLTDTAPIFWAHLVLPFVAALFAVLATARLLRLLVPSRWSWALLVWLVILLSVGDAHGWYGNMAFVRLQQGKSVLVTALLPVIWVYSIEFARRRSLPSWGLLLAANIAATGLNPTGLWLGPLATLTGLMVGFNRTEEWVEVLLGALGAVFYNLSKGLSIGLEMESFMERSVGKKTSQDLLDVASDLVLGQGALSILALVSIALALGSLRGQTSRRFILATVVMFLALCNPQWVRWIALHVTGGWTFWRIFWLVPVPLIMALGFIGLGDLLLQRWKHLRLGWIQAVAILAFLLSVPGVRLLSSQNRVRWGVGLKVPSREYQVAEYLVSKLPPKSTVLAPQSVTAWVATFENRPQPLVVRFNHLRPDLSTPSDLRIRRWLTREVSKRKLRTGGNRIIFFDFLARYDVDALVFRSVRDGPRKGRWAYRRAGFELKSVRPPYEIWFPQRDSQWNTDPNLLIEATDRQPTSSDL